MKNWIDFKQLRQSLTFEDVLRHYGVELKIKGRQHHGFCPLPNHQGKRNSPSFSANLDKGIFHCFGCGAKGNLLDFAALMEKVDPKDGTELRKVAATLQQRFGGVSVTAEQPPAQTAQPRAPRSTSKMEWSDEVPPFVNAPLDFQLKGLDASHPYLLGRGFTPETIAHFGLGLCSRGSLKDRVAIPLHDNDGKLVGYAGRVVDDSTISEDKPRYRLPGKRKRGETIFEFHKTLFLYNGWRIKEPLDDLIVVESFTGVWWLHQNGKPHVVGTMGADCSDRQAELVVRLVKPDGRVWLMPDGDAAGERFAQNFLSKVTPHRFVRWVKLAADKQPTDYSVDELTGMLGKGGAI